MRKLSLFSGILGDDLASSWAGIETVCCVEIDPFCQAVIKKHYPNMPIIGDIHDVTPAKVKEVSGYEWVDIIAGGDPCQPRSVAGKRRGREDDRDLWKDMLRVVCEFKSAWVVNENPTGRLTMDFHEVLSDLESQGYETRTFVIPACAINAPHRRDRVYVVAHSNEFGHNTSRFYKPDIQGHRLKNIKQGEVGWNKAIRTNNNHEQTKDDTNSYGIGLQRQFGEHGKEGQEIRYKQTLRCRCNRTWGANWIEVATTLCGMDDGLPLKMDGLELSAKQHRDARIAALGNAQVPQQVYPIYKAIVEVENSLSPQGYSGRGR